MNHAFVEAIVLEPSHAGNKCADDILDCGPIAHMSSNTQLVGENMFSDNLLFAEGKAIIIEGEEIIKICESSEALEEYGSPVNHIENPYNIDVENNVSVEGGRH